MIPAFLISFREILEAFLIVVTILGILTKLKKEKLKNSVYIGATAAIITNILLLTVASMFGFAIHEWYEKKETFIEGLLMIISAAFITWAVFFLHKTFALYKITIAKKLEHSIQTNRHKGLFLLTYTAVLREGFEIVLFLSTVYLSSNLFQILSGFLLGAALAIVICVGLFTATIRMPVYYAFKGTSILLIFFAAGLLAHGTHEFVEAGVLAASPNVYLPFLPEKSTFIGMTIQAMFGITRIMEMQTLALYGTYTAVMVWLVFLRRTLKGQDQASVSDRLNMYQ